MPNTGESGAALRAHNDALRERVIAAAGHTYDIGDEIGRGGMSVVYRALDRRLNRPVAIKVLPPELAFDEAIRTRFTREAQTSALLSHSHIVPIYDVGEREGIAYFVMALIEGGNLATLLAREPRQPVDTVRRLLCEVADALDYAHARGVVHRDVKPDNILLDLETGRAMVTDFGIARAIEAGTRLTATGIAIGTPTYMSPEQGVSDREIDGRSDIYALGVVAYQMLTGRVPFTARNSVALLMKHVTERPRPIVELRHDAPTDLCDAIERSLMKAPEDRWPTAAALRETLLSSPPAPRVERNVSPRAASNQDRPPALAAPAAPSSAKARPESRLPPEQRPQIEMIPPHLALLTEEQRDDLRLWHGRVHLLDRVKAIRGYAWLTLAMSTAAVITTIAGLAEGVPPAILAPIVPIYMGRKLRKRQKSLRESGLRLRNVFLAPHARKALGLVGEKRAKQRLDKELAKLAPREVLDGPDGEAIVQAVKDRTAIMEIFRDLPKEDRALVPDLEPTVKALVDRVVQIAKKVHRLDVSMNPRLIDELDGRIAEAERDARSPSRERRIALLRRQRESLEELLGQREALVQQLDSASLALSNLRLDLVRVRSSGIESGFSEVSMATQEARALSREIGTMLEAVAEVKKG